MANKLDLIKKLRDNVAAGSSLYDLRVAKDFIEEVMEVGKDASKGISQREFYGKVEDRVHTINATITSMESLEAPIKMSNLMTMAKRMEAVRRAMTMLLAEAQLQRRNLPPFI